ncbi:spore coat U domain-containing protein [Rhodanobacter sp. DHG33]|uniref:Csu type fimbrial protein n=1 Tax=Rhodanobacter sp. DHG33 TaxID=2775921 RepID=UPI00177CB251|nr:spore coat U domain-containing protein [Rhodanobacter sp. DHG33]MBD8898496.1 spore coat protein U domain-containing protein [Rhodanobacter sp. DHG33]
MKYLAYALLFMLLLVGGRVHAETCTATASSVSFGNVSPIAGTAVAASGTVSVTCTWSAITLTPSVQVCLNVGATSPRSMSDGASNLQYDLYQDAAHSLVWGSIYNGTTPIAVQLNKPATGTSASTTVSYYGLIAANQPTVPTVNNSSTVYTQGFGGNQTSLNYGFYVLIAPTCASLTTSNGTFPFTASATVVNNCLISATNVSFGSAGVLKSSLSATGSISARCTNGDAFRISLNGGSSGNVAARTLQRQGGGGTVSYQLYTDSARSIPWGDGTAGTSMMTGTGSGNAQAISVYGQVPAQATPAPGSYSDTITATIVF